MIKDRALGRVLLLTLALAVCLAVNGNAGQTKKASKKSKSPSSIIKAAPQMTLEPKAIKVIKASSSRLAAARTMSFTAVVFYESMDRFDTPLI